MVMRYPLQMRRVRVCERKQEATKATTRTNATKRQSGPVAPPTLQL